MRPATSRTTAFLRTNRLQGTTTHHTRRAFSTTIPHATSTTFWPPSYPTKSYTSDWHVPLSPYKTGMGPPPHLTLKPDPSTISLPRILCLHGGGVNSLIFKAQLRAFLSHPQLVNRFRFVFTDAPFLCDEGVGVNPVYSDWGPFRRWFRWLKTHDEIEAAKCRELVKESVLRGMEEDEGIGEWVGVLGFSQGAKLALSLLYEQQSAKQRGEKAWTGFQFGIVMAGRCPFVALSEEAEEFAWMQSAGGLSDTVDMESIQERPDMRLSLPTVHVHGLRDDGLSLHKKCIEDYCAPGTAEVVEWEGNHRVAIKKDDVQAVVQKWIELADEYGL